jgi:hypothetical protein
LQRASHFDFENFAASRETASSVRGEMRSPWDATSARFDDLARAAEISIFRRRVRAKKYF